MELPGRFPNAYKWTSEKEQKPKLGHWGEYLASLILGSLKQLFHLLNQNFYGVMLKLLAGCNQWNLIEISVGETEF